LHKAKTMQRYSTALLKATAIVFFIFLFSPTHAQIAKSINGMVVSDLKTPQGSVVVNLPDDMRPGDQITGTVTVAPEGKTEKEKQANRKKLEEYALQFPGLAMSVKDLLNNTDKNQFSFTVPTGTAPNDGNYSELELVNGSKVSAVSKIPVTPVSLITVPGKSVINLTTPVIEQGDPYVVVRSANSNMNDYGFAVKDKTGKTTKAPVLCQSPRSTVVEIPSGIPLGENTLVVQRKSGAETNDYYFEKVSADYRVDKNNLQKGETTTLTGVIRGLDSKLIEDPTLYLDNVTTSTITLQGGNEQVILINPSSNGEYTFTRTLTGITPGPFTINAILNADPKNIQDPVDREMRAIKNCDEFNEWMGALKYDLSRYASQQTDNNQKKNLGTVMDNLGPCRSTEGLDMAKARTANLLRSLAINPQTEKDWDSYYVSHEFSLQPLHDELDNKETEPVDYEMVKEFADCVQERAEKAGYDNRNGPMISKTLIQLVLLRAYAEGSMDYIKLQHKLAEQFLRACSSLPDNQKPTYKRPDPKQDFIGYLDPAKQTLWATPEQVSIIADKVGAKKAANGMYSFTGWNSFGQPVPCSYKVVVSTVADINKIFKPLATLIMNRAAIVNNNDVFEIADFQKGYLIKQDTDTKTGAIYRFYKNAECAKYGEGEFDNYEEKIKKNECMPVTKSVLKNKPSEMTDEQYLDSLWKAQKEGKGVTRDAYDTKEVETGQYFKYRKTREWYKCGKGENTCTETLSVWMVMDIYDDAGCKTLLQSKPVYPFNSTGKVFMCTPKL
jgi:hypothetical protein